MRSFLDALAAPIRRQVRALAAVALACALPAGLWLLHRSLMHDRVDMRIAMRTAHRDLDATDRAAEPACPREMSFASSLPSEISVDKLARSLQESARTFGATVSNVSAEPHAATPRTLGTLDVSVALRGSYASIKSTLAEGLSRFPSGAVQHVNLKREGAAMPVTEVASVQVVFALRPPIDGASACRLPSSSEVDRKTLSERVVPVPGGGA